MQGVHAVWSLGATVGPFIIASFLVELPPSANIVSRGENVTITTPVINRNGSDGVTSYSPINHAATVNITSCSVEIAVEQAGPPLSDVEQVRYAYVVIGSLTFVTSFLFLAAYCRGRSKQIGGQRFGSTPVPDDEESQPAQPLGASTDTNKLNHRATEMVIFITLLFLFFHFYVYIELLPIDYFPTFAIKYLMWPVHHASMLMSVFFGAHCLGRFIGIPVSTVLRPRTMVLINITLTAAAILLLLMFVGTWPDILWSSAALAAISMASTFAATILWVSEVITVSGKVSAIVMVGGSVGGMIAPLIVGQLFESGPMWLVYILVITSLSHIGLFLGMLVFVGRNRHKLE